MCEIIKNSRFLAKQKGLDPRIIHCPPDWKAICTETGCLKAGLESNAETPSKDRLQIFYDRLQKSLAEMEKHQ